MSVIESQKKSIPPQKVSYPNALQQEPIENSLRGRIAASVVPLILEGRTVDQIALDTGLRPTQIRNARGHSRHRGLMHTPTSEETRRARSESHKEKPSPIKGHHHTADTLIRMTEKRRGRELSPPEALQIQMLATARGVPVHFKEPTIQEVYHTNGMKFPEGWRNQAFIETMYALMLIETALRTPVIDRYRTQLSKTSVLSVYSEVDPNAFNRTADGIQLIDALANEKRKSLVSSVHQRHETLMYTTAIWVNGNHGDALEVIQEVLLKMVEGGISQYPENPEEQKRYLIKVIMNAARGGARKERTRRIHTVPLDLSLPSHHGSSFSAERVAMGRMELAAAMKAASPVVIYRAEGYNINEVASMLSIPIGTVKSRTSRGRTELTNLLGD